MSTSKHIDKICIAVISIALILTVLFMFGSNLGLEAAPKTVAYQKTLFDTSYVHKIDIVMNDWDTFIENCESEEYSACTVVIDGKKQGNVAIRAKGNTSLSTVRTLGSQRYSFKIEFDHYEKGKSYKGLDKLCLNNLIQDNTMMKDYLVYQLMSDFGVDSPLCSFAYLTVNGNDWGLYLCVEGIEDSFLERNYGSDAGELYKPDSMSFGGGRGNGKGFNMDDFDFNETMQDGEISEKFDFSEGFDISEMFDMPNGFEIPEDFDVSEGFTLPEDIQMPQGGQPPQMPQGGGGFGGMGSNDVKLQYIDDDPDSYSNIFDNAKTDINESDKKRLINSLKLLSGYENLEEVLDIDEVLRYFVVHNFVRNGDSYTGMMVHNYYLNENNGKLSMIPWDYNLAFGTFMGGNASSEINSSIDNPVSNGSVDDRPMVGWIFSNEEYTDMYHDLFEDFISEWFSNEEMVQLIEKTKELISPYVEKDPTKFCTTEEFEKGVDALKKFVELRGEAVKRQLSGDKTAVDTGSLNLSDMGTMNSGGNTFGGDMPGGMPFGKPDDGSSEKSDKKPDSKPGEKQSGMPEGLEMPEGFDFSEGMPGTPPGERPEGMSGDMPNKPPNGNKR